MDAESQELSDKWLLASSEFCFGSYQAAENCTDKPFHLKFLSFLSLFSNGDKGHALKTAGSTLASAEEVSIRFQSLRFCPTFMEKNKTS